MQDNTTPQVVEIITPASKVKISYRPVYDKDLLESLEGKAFIQLNNSGQKLKCGNVPITPFIPLFTLHCCMQYTIENWGNSKTIKVVTVSFTSLEREIRALCNHKTPDLLSVDFKDNQMFLVTEIQVQENGKIRHDYVFG